MIHRRRKSSIKFNKIYQRKSLTAFPTQQKSIKNRNRILPNDSYSFNPFFKPPKIRRKHRSSTTMLLSPNRRSVVLIEKRSPSVPNGALRKKMKKQFLNGFATDYPCFQRTQKTPPTVSYLKKKFKNSQMASVFDECAKEYLFGKVFDRKWRRKKEANSESVLSSSCYKNHFMCKEVFQRNRKIDRNSMIKL